MKVYQLYFGPYGYWLQANGSVIFFDRAYNPICRRCPDGTVEVTPATWWITDSVGRRYFYNDQTSPSASKNTRRRIKDIIDKLGIAEEVRQRWIAGGRGWPKRALSGKHRGQRDD